MQETCCLVELVVGYRYLSKLTHFAPIERAEEEEEEEEEDVTDRRKEREILAVDYNVYTLDLSH